MVVEVVLGEVGEDPQVECAVVDPAQVDRMGRDLGHDVRDPVIGHLPEDPLHLEGFGRGVRGGEALFAVAVVDRSQHADGMARGPEDRLQKIGDRGLAVRSDHGDQAEGGGGVTEEIPSEAAENLAAVPDADGRDAGGRGKIPFVDDEAGAVGQGVVDEFMAVRLEAGDRHKETLFFALPRMVTDRTDLAVRIPCDPEDFDFLHQQRKSHRTTFKNPCRR